MKQKLLEILNGDNLIAKQRAKRALRIRYGMTFVARERDPIWLSAHN